MLVYGRRKLFKMSSDFHCERKEYVGETIGVGDVLCRAVTDEGGS